MNNNRDKQISAWLKSMNIPVSGQNIAILWSRFSGKKGDIHLEHDTSYMGMRQIIMEAAEHYSAIMIAGDPSATPKNANKYNTMARSFGMNVYNITGFWNNKTPLLRAWGGDTRTGQFKLYDYLNRHYTSLKHLGSRSGNLEVMAMLGHNVRYMEERHSIGGERMETWHRRPDGKTAAGGMATGYERIILENPATRSGKFLKENIDTQGKRPAWAPGVILPPLVKPPQIQNYKKGFSGTDMASIRRYLNLPPAEYIHAYQNLVHLNLSGLHQINASVMVGLVKKMIKDHAFPNLKTFTVDNRFAGALDKYLSLLENRGIRVVFV